MKTLDKKWKIILYGCSGLGLNMINMIMGTHLCNAIIADGFESDVAFWTYSEKTLVGGANSAITRASLNYDADKIVFSMRDKKDPSYNLYKINADGSKLEKLTSSHYNDMDPAWLPDGNIVFVSTRSNHYIRCAGSAFRGTTLARCDADGKNIYFILFVFNFSLPLCARVCNARIRALIK